MKEDQLALFEPPPQRRRSGSEDRMLVEAVRRLRKNGHQVYAAGRSHQVDGNLLSTAQLLELAAAYAGAKA